MQVSMWASTAMSLLLDQWEELILAVSEPRPSCLELLLTVCNCEVEGLGSEGFMAWGMVPRAGLSVFKLVFQIPIREPDWSAFKNGKESPCVRYVAR